MGGRSGRVRALAASAVAIAVLVTGAWWVASSTGPDDAELFRDALRPPGTREQFYFVLTDRFANGDPGNDHGGLPPERLASGFDPTDQGFHHGGDLAGLRERLPYLEGLGTTALWLTPSFANRPVQGTGADASSSYHGYWPVDFTRVDPHLGTNEELRALIDDAHARGIKVFLDVITNHTADVIAYEGGGTTYVSKAERPYQAVDGQPFDDAAAGASGTFPAVDAATVAPYVPTFRTPADATAKTPAWLNDPTMYHNRGDTTWAGESDTYGDFVGLDDLWTERPEVVEGLIEVYRGWIDLGVDGFRVDTVRHVDLAFWKRFAPAMLEHAGPDFFLFGEVYSAEPAVLSHYSTAGRLPATLDFAFQDRARAWAAGGPAADLAALYAMDDYYTDHDSNAASLPTFLGNHDMGRIGFFLAGVASGEELLARTRLAHSLMFLTRGQPVVYYGDEQGLAGDGGDKDARQDLFATQVASYAAEPVIGGEAGARDRYDPAHPLYRHIAELSALRREHPVLATGNVEPVEAGGGLLAFTRRSPGAGEQYLVVLNNAATPVDAAVQAGHDAGAWRPVYGAPVVAAGEAPGELAVSVPAFGALVFARPAPVGPAGDLALAELGGVLVDGAPLRVVWPDAEGGQVSFHVRVAGERDWRWLGTDDTRAEFMVYASLPEVAPGTRLEVRAIGKASDGSLASDTAEVVLQRP